MNFEMSIIFSGTYVCSWNQGTYLWTWYMGTWNQGTNAEVPMYVPGIEVTMYDPGIEELMYVTGIEVAINSGNILPPTALDPKISSIKPLYICILFLNFGNFKAYFVSKGLR